MATAIDDAIRKISPLRPNDVRRWKRQLLHVDGETKKLLEWKILRTASELLGDVDTRLLLSCPPPEVCNGEFEVGRVVYERELWPFFMRRSEVLQHVAIFGRSGSGKTNVVFGILKQLVDQRVPFLFFDWKRTVRHLLPSLGREVQVYTPGRSVIPFRFNPFHCPPGVEQHVYITLVVDLLGRAFTLGDGAKSVLHRLLVTSGESPTVAELLAKAEGLDAKGRQAGWQASAVRALQTLLFLDIVGAGERSQADVVEQFFRRSTVLELNGLNQNAKRFLIPAILQWVYQVRLGSDDREQLRLVVVLEEAHHVLGDRQSEEFFARFLRQCRELGIAVVLVDQAPSLMSSVALGNCFTTICLNLKDPSDARTAGGLLQLSEHDRGFLSQLPVGQGVAKLQGRWSDPFLLQFPHVALRKGAVSDDHLRLLSVEAAAGSSRSPFAVAQSEGVRLRLPDEVLDSPAFEFLLDVVGHPDSGVKERYRRLRWSVDKGNRIKQQILKVGLLEGQLLPLGHTRRLVLRPTSEGRRLLGLEKGATIESVAHEFWKRRCAQEYQDHGWQVDVEAPRDPARPELGRADLVLTRGEERWAVEVETGKSDVVATVRHGILAGFARIVVVPTDEKARGKVETDLARAGLLLDSRVRLQS